MSSPLNLFRKYQYVFLVVLGVILMFTFVIAPPIADYMGQKQMAAGAADEVVVTWVGGEVRETDLIRMHRSHFATLRFLNAVRLASELPERDFQFTNDGRMVRIDKNGRPLFYFPSQARSEEALLQKVILARKAASLGIVIDDDTITEYLGRLILDTPVRGDQLNSLLDQVNPKEPRDQITVAELFDQLRIELAADRTAELLGMAPLASTPAEDREYFDRLNRRVKAELLPLPVNDYVSQVEEPSEAEIAALYEKHKEDFRDPYSPDPGFRRRLRIAFAFVKADMAPYMEEELAKAKEKITDAEIEKHYRENPHLYQVRSQDEVPPEPRPRGPEKEPTDNEPTGNKKTDNDSSQSQTPATEETPDGTDDTGADEKQPDGQEPESNPSQPENPQSYRMPPRHKQVFVTALAANQNPENDEDATQPETTDDDAPEPADAAQPDSPTADTATVPPGESAPPDAEAAGDKPTSAAAESGTEGTGAKGTGAKGTRAKGADAEASGDTTADDAKPPASRPATQKPLRPLDDKLKGEIREKLATANARLAARSRVDEAIKNVERDARSFARAYARWEDRGKESGEPQPAPLDPEALAQKYGLSGKPALVAGTTGLLDAIDVGETEIGKSFTFNPQTGRQVSFAALAYNESTQLYMPEKISHFLLDTEYCFWKTKQDPSHVPALADVRAEVIQAWKKNRAVLLAKEDAEKKSSQARAEKKSLQELFANDKTKVIETEEFSWLTYGNIAPGSFNPPRLSEVIGVEAAGQDFMTAVFALHKGEVGVALDEPHSVVYVVRLAEEVKSTKQLDEDFFEGLRQGVDQLAMQNRFEITGEWYRDIGKEMKITWRRDPRSFIER